MEKKNNIDPNTPIACLTYGQFISAIKESLQEPPKKELPKFLTVPQLAELTGYAIATINIKNSKKEIPGSIKRGGKGGRGGRVLFETEKILEWIKSDAVKTRGERLQELEDNFCNIVRK